MTDVLDELGQAYSFLRDPLLGKAIDEIAEQRRTIEQMRRDLHELRHEVQILVEANRDLYMQMEYERK
jgi:regulator of replication initiation timing